jgi:hypothetical protein
MRFLRTNLLTILRPQEDSLEDPDDDLYPDAAGKEAGLVVGGVEKEGLECPIGGVFNYRLEGGASLDLVCFTCEGAVHLRGTGAVRHEFIVARHEKSARRGKYLKYSGV